ncbi:hypothetical protein LZ012_16095 [Dechloromonas sp. XY25]|uniref:Uncharacterized protein n=1 Tax=Dechloromonas hankyongensis TaxID=2908002 RepID=A0ABS9K5T4_9RHOO|nr:hypothetical protein [Dechloromonas hankyongensis]MCG2578518.1 hypothetical protein [Dechloromonas hankyongensis]
MEQDEYAQLQELSDRELYDFVTEKDSSQRKWVALHLLEQRRNAVLTSAAKSSARAAWLAAAVAGISAIIAVLAYFGGKSS